MNKTSHTILYVTTGASDTLTTVEEDHLTNRFNDAKCDRQGRLWAGTMGFEEEPGKLNPHMGSLYSYTGGTLLLVERLARNLKTILMEGNYVHVSVNDLTVC